MLGTLCLSPLIAQEVELEEHQIIKESYKVSSKDGPIILEINDELCWYVPCKLPVEFSVEKKRVEGEDTTFNAKGTFYGYDITVRTYTTKGIFADRDFEDDEELFSALKEFFEGEFPGQLVQETGSSVFEPYSCLEREIKTEKGGKYYSMLAAKDQILCIDVGPASSMAKSNFKNMFKQICLKRNDQLDLR